MRPLAGPDWLSIKARWLSLLPAIIKPARIRGWRGLVLGGGPSGAIKPLGHSGWPLEGELGRHWAWRAAARARCPTLGPMRPTSSGRRRRPWAGRGAFPALSAPLSWPSPATQWQQWAAISAAAGRNGQTGAINEPCGRSGRSGGQSLSVSLSLPLNLNLNLNLDLDLNLRPRLRARAAAKDTSAGRPP